MGENGWIPLDNTAFEIDFVDSGHIRIGELSSNATAFNGKSIEVLDYKAGRKKMGKKEETGQKFKKYLGEYSAGRKKMIARVENRSLVIEIPGRTTLPFNEPDDEGLWHCKYAPSIYLTFEENNAGKVDCMYFYQILNLRKKSSLKKADPDVPKKLKDYPGTYFLAQANLNLEIYYRNGFLSYIDPKDNKTEVILHKTDKETELTDKKNSYYFKKDDQGEINSLKIITKDKFKHETKTSEK